MNVLIIEDEIASQNCLRDILRRRFPEITIMAIEDNVPDAIISIKKNHPDLIFLDIEIKEGSGFDVLAATLEYTKGLIITTAFNQFAIDAFKYHAIDYVLKPLDELRIVDAIELFKARYNSQLNNANIVRMLDDLKTSRSRRISIFTLDGIEFIDEDDIVFAAAKSNYTEFKLRSGRNIIASKTLKEVEKTLEFPTFCRIHHSYIVSVNCVKKYHRGRGGFVTMVDNTDLPVSVAKRDDFLRLIMPL